MERLRQRIDVADQALQTFESNLEEDLQDDVRRDAAIQRVQYSLEAVWKAVQRHLKVKEGLEVASPKGVVRASFQVGLIGEAEAEEALLMVDDRNLTVHTYNRDLAISLASRLDGHRRILRLWLDAASEQIRQSD